MADILFFVKGTHGDLEPIWTLGPTLKARGHRVTLLSHCSYIHQARQSGFDFIAIDTPSERQSFLEDGYMLNTPRGFPDFYRRHMLPKILAEYKALEACKHPGTTLLVSPNKSGLLPLLAAEKLAIPFVRLFVAPSELIALPLMGEMYQAILGPEINALRQQLGLAAVTDWQAWLQRPEQNMALWPDWFAPTQGVWPIQVTSAGFVETPAESPAALAEDIQQFLQAGEAPVLITAGTGRFLDARFYAASVEACRLLDCRAIVATRYTDLVPPNLPPQAKHVEFLPFASLMPLNQAVIHHGGIGTLVQAMSAGIPQLILPSGADRPDNAARAKALGIADFLPMPRWDPEAIAEKLKTLMLSTQVATRCQELACQLRQANSPPEAALSIEATLTISAMPSRR